LFVNKLVFVVKIEQNAEYYEKYTLVSTTNEIKELTTGDVNLVIAWLVPAPVRNSPVKPI
jgi:hypothetical protein